MGKGCVRTAQTSAFSAGRFCLFLSVLHRTMLFCIAATNGDPSLHLRSSVHRGGLDVVTANKSIAVSPPHDF
eukprot:scaffold182282_cov16-Tisochrysis_lutea.AAC.2